MIVRDTEAAYIFLVSARGEMQIAVLVEQMRREGYEVLVSRPEVILKKDASGRTLEPFETLWAEVPNECLGDAMQNIWPAKRWSDVHARVIHTVSVWIARYRHVV